MWEQTGERVSKAFCSSSSVPAVSHEEGTIIAAIVLCARHGYLWVSHEHNIITCIIWAPYERY